MKRLVILVLCAMLPLSPNPSSANTGVQKPFRIFAVLWRGETDVEAGFRDYLNQRRIPFELTVRNLKLNRGNVPPILEEIAREKPDLVYTWGTGTTSSVLGRFDSETPERFVEGIPGLFVMVAYPQKARIVKSYEETGRPVTGVSFLAPVEVQLNAILAYRPFKTIAVIYDEKASNSRINVEQLREEATKMQLNLIVLPVPLNDNGRSDPRTLPGLVETAKARGADILYMGPDSFLTRHGKTYTGAAIKAGLPIFASTQAPLKDHRATFGLVTDYHTLGKLAGYQAEQILVEKKRPEDIPVKRLARYKLWINIDVARLVKIYPPMSMIPIAYITNSAVQ